MGPAIALETRIVTTSEIKPIPNVKAGLEVGPAGKEKLLVLIIICHNHQH